MECAKDDGGARVWRLQYKENVQVETEGGTAGMGQAIGGGGWALAHLLLERRQ